MVDDASEIPVETSSSEIPDETSSSEIIPVEASSAPPVAVLSLLTFAVMSLLALLLTQ